MQTDTSQQSWRLQYPLMLRHFAVEACQYGWASYASGMPFTVWKQPLVAGGPGCSSLHGWMVVELTEHALQRDKEKG